MSSIKPTLLRAASNFTIDSFLEYDYDEGFTVDVKDITPTEKANVKECNFELVSSDNEHFPFVVRFSPVNFGSHVDTVYSLFYLYKFVNKKQLVGEFFIR